MSQDKVMPNRILNCDALQIIKDLPDAFVDLLITDPPYGNNTAYGETHKRRIAGDEHPLVGLMAGPFVRFEVKLGISVCAWKFEKPPPPCEEMKD